MNVGSRVRSCAGHFLLDPKDPLYPYSWHEHMNSKAMYNVEGIFFSEWEQKGYTRWAPPSAFVDLELW